MKRLLNVIVLLLSCVSIMKAEQLVATLQSGDATKAFYGYSAIVDAYNEASDGDIITLSKGNFENVTIEKAITLRGAAAFVEGHSTTINDLTVNADYAVVEGIYVTNLLSIKGNNQQLLRCNINVINSDDMIRKESPDPATRDIFIADCAIRTDGQAFDCVNATYKNCAIRNEAGDLCTERSSTYINCIIGIGMENLCWTSYNWCRSGCYFNCILYAVATHIDLYTPSQYYDTIIYSTGDVQFMPGVQKKNCVISQISKEEFDNKFELLPNFFAEEVHATDVNSAFVCGVVDHKEWPAIPRVIESNIDKETDSAGHLKVEVKVSCER